MKSKGMKAQMSSLCAAIVCAGLVSTMALAGCASTDTTSSASASAAAVASSESSTSAGTSSEAPVKDDIQVDEVIENTADGEHAVEASGTSDSYANVEIVKSGEADGDEADFYGENAAVFATDGATLDLSNVIVETDGTHANGVFSYGEGTTVNVSDSVIETSGNCSGGLMTTGGGTMNASNLRITTAGNSSAAIRSDRGGGTVNVDGGVYTTSGMGSPVIYSTADITVSNAQLESTASQGVVVEGKNSVTLNDVALTADNNTKNSDKSDYYQAVMIYQSMSGDAAEGEASFTMDGGSLVNENGDVFFVNNTVATIALSQADIVNESDGVFLWAAAAGWGSEGSNGGQVTLKATDQAIDGDMLVDGVSTLNLYLADGSAFEGAINPDGADGDVYVELSGGSKWTLTADSYITSLTCDADSVDLNGHTLYVDGKAYESGTAQTGEAIEVTVQSSGNGGQGEGGTPPDMPEGASGQAPSAGSGDGKPSGEPPAKPGDGSGPSGKPSGERPAKPGSSSGSASSSSSSSNSSSGSASKSSSAS